MLNVTPLSPRSSSVSSVQFIQSAKLRMKPSTRRWKPVNLPKNGEVTLLYTSRKLPWFVRLIEYRPTRTLCRLPYYFLHFGKFRNRFFRHLKRYHLYHHSPRGMAMGYGITS